MLQPFSQIDKAFRDTLITTAEAQWFTNLALLYGLPYPASYPLASWRKALLACAFGPRGTPGCTHAVFDGIFDHAHEEFTISLDPTQPQRITFVEHTNPGTGESPLLGFIHRHVQRLVRIKFIPASALPVDETLLDHYPEDLPWVEKVFWTVGPAFNGTVLGPPQTDWPCSEAAPWLELAKFDTGQFTGAHWDSRELEIGSFVLAYATILAFRYREPTPGPILNALGYAIGTQPGDPCEVQLETDVSQFIIPGRYLIEPAGADVMGGAIPAALKPFQPPPGGHIMDEFNIAEDVPPPPDAGDIYGDGPHPIYLDAIAGMELTQLMGLLDPLLASGVKLTMVLREFSICDALVNLHSLLLSGSLQYVNFPNGDAADMSGRTDWAVSLWLKPLELNRLQGIYGNEDHWIRLQADNTIGVQVADAVPASLYVSGTTALEVDKWYHITLTSDGTTLNLYLDSVLEATTTWPGGGGALFASPETPKLGWDGINGFIGYLRGKIDEMTTWSEFLTLADVQELYNLGYPTNPKLHTQGVLEKLLSWYRFGDHPLDTAAYPGGKIRENVYGFDHAVPIHTTVNSIVHDAPAGIVI